MINTTQAAHRRKQVRPWYFLVAILSVLVIFNCGIFNPTITAPSETKTSQNAPPFSSMDSESSVSTNDDTSDGGPTSDDDYISDVYSGDWAEVHRMQVDLGEMLKDMEAKSEPCWRTCSQHNNKYPNHIVYTNTVGGSGLVDRFYVIERLINVAGYLCATLHIPKPNELLGAKHNLYNELSDQVEWKDFRHFHWAQTGEDAFEEMESPWTYVSETWSISDADDGSRRSRPTLFLDTVRDDQSLQHFLQLEEFVNTTITTSKDDNNDDKNSAATSPEKFFVWQIGEHFWALDLLHWPLNESRAMLSDRPASYPDGMPYWRKGCRHYSSSIPSRVQAVSDRISNEIKSLSKDSTTGIFHIRRGDMQHECDTTLPQLKKFIDCSFAGSAVLGNITILISTDEEDLDYLNIVISYLERYPHVKARSLDQLTRRHTRQFLNETNAPMRFVNNNFFVYMVMNVVQHQHTSFLIQQRRWFACPACTSLLEMKDVSWTGEKRDRDSLDQ